MTESFLVNRGRFLAGYYSPARHRHSVRLLFYWHLPLANDIVIATDFSDHLSAWSHAREVMPRVARMDKPNGIAEVHDGEIVDWKSGYFSLETPEHFRPTITSAFMSGL